MAAEPSNWSIQTKKAIFYPKAPNPGGKKPRVFVYLPEQVYDSLQIVADDSNLSFAENPKIPYVIVTKAENIRKALAPLGAAKDDSQVKLVELGQELIELDAKLGELAIAFSRRTVDDEECKKERNRILHRRDEILTGLEELSANKFRGSKLDVDELESIQVVSIVSEQTEGVVSGVGALLSDSERNSEALEGLKRLLDEGMIDEVEYNRAKKLSESRLKLIDDSIQTIAGLLSAKS
jgi:hypothetical protein